MTWPMIGTGFTVNMLQRGGAALQRINEILDEVPDITSPEEARSVHGSGRLEIRNLRYTYPDSTSEAIVDLSLQLEPGQTLGILGPTGSGKTTLLRILTRLLDPPEGTVFLDGLDIRSYNLSALRSRYGVVAQDSFLFSASIRDNIAFGSDSSPEDRIQEVADISTITRDIHTFPSGFDTMVGERGVTLSGGQKQRIAISRALLIQPEILLLDDALSAVDTGTEEHILERLITERAGKTTIIVSHRVSTLWRADSIGVMENGRLTGTGTPEELYRADGFFRRVADIQRIERRSGTDA
jgi:ATP-binding cassette, subfamily B, multidrug efflux pump